MKIFLDIDGVMVHANPHRKVELDDDGFYKFNSVAVQILRSVVFSTKDELILSTSHRFRFNISQWKRIFQSRGISINKISILGLPVETKCTRKTEILNWISRNHMDWSEIVLIDDDKTLNELHPHLKERLVLTNSYVGLSASDDNIYRVFNRAPKRTRLAAGNH